MEDFNQYMSDYQTRWRHRHLENQVEGDWNGEKRPWILPRELWEEGLWSGIRSGRTNSITAYLDDTGVQKHNGVHNLKSSWVQCANLYFSFREDREIITDFLRMHVSSLIESVDCVELEWAEEPPLDPTTLLGEPQGRRGSNQTSPDIAFKVNGGKGILLIENKFVEHSFYACSGRDKKYGNPDRQRCMNLVNVYKDTANQCYQRRWVNGKRTNRKYWDYLKFNTEGLTTLKQCPAATAGYQLFRQHALAEALVQKGSYEFVVSCVAYDARNQTLIECLRSTGVDDFAKGWSSLFKGKSQFATFTHQQWVDWVEDHDAQHMRRDWLTYVRQRYEL